MLWPRDFACESPVVLRFQLQMRVARSPARTVHLAIHLKL